MKLLWALVLALGCMHVHGAPMKQAGMEEGSCEDAFAKSAAGQALIKINQDRKEGYIFSLHRLSNVHMMKHGETGVVFYLTLDVVETNCSVLNKRDFKTCEARPSHDTPVYGQCKAAIYINKVHRVVRLYKYSCDITPVPAARLHELCPDCPSLINMDDDEIKKTVSLSLEKFNIESGLGNRFSLLKVTRALAGNGMVTHYNAEYTIQETTCPRSTDAPTAEKCPLMDCEFAHKGFCKASLFYSPSSPPVDEGNVAVECEIYEPEAAERQKKLHLLGGETNHSHTHTQGHTHDHDQAHAADQTHDHDQAHAADQTHDHDHVHDHTKSHVEHDKTQQHADNNDHHHTHDHDGHRHSHAHSHDHGHKHDHVHAHHAKAHNHSGDSPHHHHDYKHADGEHTHDHELALDHDHKHAHLHEHEHHHHHHDHDHETTSHDHPQGMVRMLPAMGSIQSTTVPDVPTAEPEVGVTLPLKEDPQIPRQMEPTIQDFPTALSFQCTARQTLVEKLFAEDPRFKPAA